MRPFSEIKLFDLPTNAGCLDLGTEKLPNHFRKYGLVEKLKNLGIQIKDLGEIPVPSEPRNNTPPIRNFPLSYQVWKRTESFLENEFSTEPASFILGLGGDCSMVVGTVAAAARACQRNIHLLYLDGDVDSIAPDLEKCVGAAGMGLWFLTQKSEFWDGIQISVSQITVIGQKKSPETDLGIPSVSLDELRHSGLRNRIEDVLLNIPKDAQVLVHFDVDLLCAADMPASYAPREEGLTLQEAEILLKVILADPRVRYLEISEFMADKDPDGRSIKALIDLLIDCLPR